MKEQNYGRRRWHNFMTEDSDAFDVGSEMPDREDITVNLNIVAVHGTTRAIFTVEQQGLTRFVDTPGSWLRCA